ncbi:putative aspartyl protease [Sesamum alatum]|uniref:Aspartyl protease n=1 Tax=Sesamum alatum TaxID=300844 RepID=A0AAE1YMP6_9LAMI|nr:putative aspartyl protease [Sesamum alatum]
MSASSFLSLFSSLFFLFSLSSANSTVTLSISPSASAPPLSNPWQRLNHLATASATRAHHLKHPQASTSAVKAPIFPHGYGGYSISLSFGTPPQTLSFLMDTGSSLVWFPCTQSFSCSSCNFIGVDPENITTFLPRLSSSTKTVGCKDPKCRWISANVQCDGCRKNSTGCDESCPPFRVKYGSGSTSGLLISETLIFPEKSVENFIVGCSIFASTEPSGIAGFGRGPDSLPAQMGLKRFSYCLVSHEFDDQPVHSNLVLETAIRGGAGTGTAGGRINYIPFSKNPTTPKHPAYKEYYYVTLQKITVGGVDVRVPYKFLVADAEGRGGTMVDSGTTFTFMENQVYKLVAGELAKQVGKNYSRAAEVENLSGLGPCFRVSDENSFTVPELAFHFKGGAKMALPVENYFSPLVDSAVCMTITTDSGGGGGGGVRAGPAIIFGNYQQQNIYMEYDLENERLGFRKQVCNNK